MLLSVYTVVDTNPDTCYDVIIQSFDSYYAPYVISGAAGVLEKPMFLTYRGDRSSCIYKNPEKIF